MALLVILRLLSLHQVNVEWIFDKTESTRNEIHRVCSIKFQNFHIFHDIQKVLVNLWEDVQLRQRRMASITFPHPTPHPRHLFTFFRRRVNKIFVLWPMGRRLQRTGPDRCPSHLCWKRRTGKECFLLWKKRERRPVLAAPATISGVLAARARARLFGRIYTPNGALRTPPHPSQLRCFLFILPK